ncbi:MAG TPA: porin [Gemmatimonadales bacterium]|nr:porin [Gemmatimonadales bacterium]
MSFRRLRLAPFPAIAGLLLPALARAQTPTVRVGGRAQAMYRFSWGDSSNQYNTTALNNGFEIRRLRIQADVRLADNVLLVIQPSFEMAALRMRDAYVRLGLSPHVGVTIGQEKSPFQRYEFTSSNNLPSIERGVRIYGLTGKEGLNDILVNNGYAAQDLGAFVDGDFLDRRVFVKAGVSNGSRESSLDVNNAKSFFGRVALTPLVNAGNQPVLQIGAAIAARDRAVCAVCTGAVTYFADSSKMTTAFALDVEVGGFRPGFHLIADLATGDNVPLPLRVNTGRFNNGNLRNSADSNVVTFRGASVIGAYRVETRGSETRLVRAVEPALRVDYTDPNTNVAGDHGILLTPVLNLYFSATTLMRAGVDFYSYKDALGASRTAQEFKLMWQASF